MTITKNIDGKTATLFVEGRVDTNTSEEFENEILQLENLSKLIVDFEKVDYISSAGLRVLLNAHKKFAAKEGLTVKNVCSQVMEIFDITGFKDVLDIK